MKILHICHLDKFIPPFIGFINNNFQQEDHTFFVSGDREKFPFDSASNIIYQKYFLSKKAPFNALYKTFQIICLMSKHDKIILHGAFNIYFLILLTPFSYFLKKMYWVIWGGDLYVYNKPRKNLILLFFHFVRKIIFKRIGHIITYVKGDYELANKWYGCRAKYHECFMYLSNLYKNIELSEKTDTSTWILVGNSADPTNNHLEIFNKLKKYKDQNIKIFAPLSYGNKKYAEEIVVKGKEIFGNKFLPLVDFMSFDEYNKFLSQIDIGIFAHKRQQGMGNIITLLGLGKKVYMRSDVTSYRTFKDLGLEIFDFKNDDVNFRKFESQGENNKTIISSYFTEKNLIQQLKKLFVKNKQKS